jgi:hypothetical protein
MKCSPYLPIGKVHQAIGAYLVRKGLLWEYMLPTTIAWRLTYSHLPWHSVMITPEGPCVSGYDYVGRE